MKKLYMHLVCMVIVTVLFMALATSLPVYAQTIPDVQWSKSSATITAVTDGNLAASVSGLPAGQIAGQGIVNYTLAGNPIRTTVLQGFTELNGRLGLKTAPFQTVDIMAATTDGGLVLYGQEFGTGLGILAKLNSGGLQTFVAPLAQGTYVGLTVDDLIATADGGFLVVFTAFANFTDTHKDTFANRYDSQGALIWSRSIAYPNAGAGGPDQSITKAEAAIKAIDGGYLLVGYYASVGPANTIPAAPFEPLLASANAVGWIAKLSENGTVVWQKLLNGLRVEFIGDGPAPGSVVAFRTVTDVIVAADGIGYAIVGAGIPPSSLQVPAPVTGMAELAADGTYKRGRLNGSEPTKAALTLYKTGGLTYYTVGNTSLQNGADPQVSLINPADLNAITATRIFESPSNSTFRTLGVAGDGSLIFSTSQESYKLNAAGPVGSTLTVTPPAYDCTSGQLTINVSGAANAPVEYQILGLRTWGSSPIFVVPAYQRMGTSFTMEVRQNGQSVSALFISSCSTAPVTPTELSLLPPAYDCTTGQLTIQVSGSIANLEFRVVGLRDWGASPAFTVPTYQRLNTSFTLEARLLNGSVLQLPFTTACSINPPVPPPTSALTFATTTLDCTGGSGASLRINLAGIAFSPTNGIEYKIPGLADWQPSNAFNVPGYQTSGTTFTLYARRVNTPQEFTTQFTATCPVGTRQGIGETTVALQVMLYPNPVGEQFTVEVLGAAQQAVRFELSDTYGRSLQTRRVDVQSDHHQETFSLPQTTAGLYFLRVATPQQAVTMKVVKP